MTLINSIKKISKNILIIAGLTVMAVGGLVMSPAIDGFAQLLPGSGSVCPKTGCPVINTSDKSRDALPKFASQIAQFMTFIIGSIAIIFVLYGAFLWLTDQEKGAEKGRKIITNAVIALVISVVAYGLIGVVLNFLNSADPLNNGAGGVGGQ